MVYEIDGVTIDMWDSDNKWEKGVYSADCYFYPHGGDNGKSIYRGNLYRNGAMFGDYHSTDSVAIERVIGIEWRD